MTIKLSFCIIVKNESQNLIRCLNSVKDLVDEIIFIDTGSADNSIDIARSFGAKIFNFTWINDFSKAKNFALEKASGDWILFLDADEELSASSSQQLRPLIESGDADAYRLIVRNLQPMEDLVPFIDTRITRLFKKSPEYMYEGMIHEQITPSITRNGGKCEDSEILVIHYGYLFKETQSGNSRAQRNLKLLQLALNEIPDDAYLLFQMGSTYKSLRQKEEALHYFHQSLQYSASLSAETLELLYMKLAQIYLSNHDDEKTMHFAKLCLSINPNNIPALYAHALTEYSVKKYQEAYNSFEKLLSLPVLSDEDRQYISQAMEMIKESF